MSNWRDMLKDYPVIKYYITAEDKLNLDTVAFKKAVDDITQRLQRLEKERGTILTQENILTNCLMVCGLTVQDLVNKSTS